MARQGDKEIEIARLKQEIELLKRELVVSEVKVGYGWLHRPCVLDRSF